MSRPVYKVVTFDLIGKKIYTFEELPELEPQENRGRIEYVFKGTNNRYPESHLWHLTTRPPMQSIPHTEKLLPYFADVTEDIPTSCRGLKAKTYKGCQLMSQKHGGYLQFLHEPTGEVLRIAINSNYYTPINLEVSK